MAVLTKAAFLSKWSSLFADNSTRDISEQDLRDFRLDISDSFLSINDNFIDEDSFASDSPTKAPSQQSTKAYIATQIPTLSNGTYTPTLTVVTNISASASSVCQYLRVGNTVTVSGLVSLTPTASATGFVMRISLPIASNLANVQEAAGCATGTGVDRFAAIYADPTNNTAVIDGVAPSSGSSLGYLFTFTYRII